MPRETITIEQYRERVLAAMDALTDPRLDDSPFSERLTLVAVNLAWVNEQAVWLRHLPSERHIADISQLAIEQLDQVSDLMDGWFRHHVGELRRGSHLLREAALASN